MTITSIRNLDEELLKEMKMIAIERKQPVGELLNEAIREWKQRHRNRKPSLLDIKPRSFGPGTEMLSQQIDEILAEEDTR